MKASLKLEHHGNTYRVLFRVKKDTKIVLVLLCFFPKLSVVRHTCWRRGRLKQVISPVSDALALLCTWGQHAHNWQKMDVMFISDHRGDCDPGAVHHLNSQNTEAMKPQKLSAF